MGVKGTLVAGVLQAEGLEPPAELSTCGGPAPPGSIWHPDPAPMGS